MRADASHASAIRIAEHSAAIARDVAPSRPAAYVDYGKPPRGQSLAFGAAALCAAWMLLALLRVGLL